MEQTITWGEWYEMGAAYTGVYAIPAALLMMNEDRMHTGIHVENRLQGALYGAASLALAPLAALAVWLFWPLAALILTVVYVVAWGPWVRSQVLQAWGLEIPPGGYFRKPDAE